MHERGLHIDAEDDAEPDQVDAQVFGGRAQQRDDNEGKFEEVEEERQHEDEGVDEQQEADLSARQRNEQMLDPQMPANPVKSEREHARADQNEHHEGRELGSRLNGL